eukprot:5874961-Amphidinium_carterae.1
MLQDALRGHPDQEERLDEGPAGPRKLMPPESRGISLDQLQELDERVRKRLRTGLVDDNKNSPTCGKELHRDNINLHHIDRH